MNQTEHDDMQEIVEDIHKAREYSRQASALSVAALIISGIALIIRVVLAQ